MKNNHFSHIITVFQGRFAPEEGLLVGYGALIRAFDLQIPYPNKLVIISSKNRQYNTDQWIVLTPRHEPEDSLYKQLTFGLKYEGINLLFYKKLFEKLTEEEILELIQIEPLGQYSRKIWFLYEWLNQKTLPIKDLDKGNFVDLIDSKLQYCLTTVNRSSRHRIVNNLPGTIDFCPLIHKTEKLEKYISANLSNRKNTYLNTIQKSILQRASAFLLLKDSKASFTIEGESPLNNRAIRWGKAIGQAGGEELSKAELNRLQQIIIENSRFIELGFRKKGGFIGEHDRDTATPIPEHISAKWQDIEQLMDGLIVANKLMDYSSYDAILAASTIAFGFVFIHPFEDGNGRLHRYIIHHVLAKKRFTQQGIIFPVSASILDHIDDYRKVLESYSHPLLDFIQWEETDDHNVEVINNTIDFYRYFDATKQAEFLYDCVEDTLERVIPEEINYLQCYDQFKKYLDNTFEMPDKMVALLIGFLDQNNGKISKRAGSKEFSKLKEDEINEIEKVYNEIFMDRSYWK